MLAASFIFIFFIPKCVNGWMDEKLTSINVSLRLLITRALLSTVVLLSCSTVEQRLISFCKHVRMASYGENITQTFILVLFSQRTD